MITAIIFVWLVLGATGCGQETLGKVEKWVKGGEDYYDL